MKVVLVDLLKKMYISMELVVGRNARRHHGGVIFVEGKLKSSGCYFCLGHVFFGKNNNGFLIIS